MPREVDGKKFVGEFGGKFLASRYFSGTFQVSNSELLRDTILSLLHFSKALIGYQEK